MPRNTVILQIFFSRKHPEPSGWFSPFNHRLLIIFAEFNKTTSRKLDWQILCSGLQFSEFLLILLSHCFNANSPFLGHPIEVQTMKTHLLCHKRNNERRRQRWGQERMNVREREIENGRIKSINVKQISFRLTHLSPLRSPMLSMNESSPPSLTGLCTCDCFNYSVKAIHLPHTSFKESSHIHSDQTEEAKKKELVLIISDSSSCLKALFIHDERI